VEQYIGSIGKKTTGIYDPKERKRRFQTSIAKLNPQFRPGTNKKIIYKGTDPKARVNISFPIPGSRNIDLPYVNITCHILEKKLLEHLRSVIGSVNDMSVISRYVFSDTFCGEVSIQFTCVPLHAEKLVDTCIDVIKHYQWLGPSDRDLESARLFFKKQLTRQTSLHWLLNLRFEATDPEKKLFEDTNKLAALVPQDFCTLFNKIFPLSNYSTIILHPETMRPSKLAPQTVLFGVAALIGIIGLGLLARKLISKE